MTSQSSVNNLPRDKIKPCSHHSSELSTFQGISKFQSQHNQEMKCKRRFKERPKVWSAKRVLVKVYEVKGAKRGRPSLTQEQAKRIKTSLQSNHNPPITASSPASRVSSNHALDPQGSQASSRMSKTIPRKPIKRNKSGANCKGRLTQMRSTRAKVQRIERKLQAASM